MKSSKRTKRSTQSPWTGRANSQSKKTDSWHERVRKVDPSDLGSDFAAWPSLAKEKWSETSIPSFDGSNFNRVILVGMGGSLLSGELIVDLAREKQSKVSFETVKDYHLPPYCDGRTLVIGMSSSGNTEETLSVLSEAHKKGLKSFALGSGGTLESLSKNKWGFDFIRTTMLKVPRSSLPAIFYPVLKLLATNHMLDFTEEEIEESFEALEQAKQRSSNESKLKVGPFQLAKELVRETTDLFPLVYASARTRAVGLRFRQSLNENAKIHAFNGEIPELCHNEIVGWDYDASSIKKYRISGLGLKTSSILLRLNEDDPPEIRTRFDIVQEIVRKSKGKTLEAPYVGKGYLARVISMLYLLDYATYYIAILKGVDPIKTPSITLLKTELADRLNYVAGL